MSDSYPYMMAYGKIAQIFDKIRKAAEPTKFTHAFLKQLGFTSTNDRAVIPLLKKLGFLNEDSTPTPKYKELRDTTAYRYILGDQIKELYSDLYAIDTNIHEAGEDEIKGAISRVTGKDEAAISRFYNTYKTLTDIAEFEERPKKAEPLEGQAKEKQEVDKRKPEIKLSNPNIGSPEFHYNIQIHLPATTDISVYNAIFKSIKENLL